MDEGTWFYAQGGQQQGPVSFDALAQMLREGRLAPIDLIWRQGMPQWTAANAVPEFAGTIPPAQFPQQPGQPFLNYYTPPTQVLYAGFWTRFCAAFIDGIITQVMGMIVGFIFGFVVGLTAAGSGAGSVDEVIQIGGFFIGAAIAWLYEALMESSASQATLGKMAVGIKVCDMTGARIGFGRATGRHFGKYVSGLLILIGYVMAAFTERKQALHDIMAGTLVVRK